MDCNFGHGNTDPACHDSGGDFPTGATSLPLENLVRRLRKTLADAPCPHRVVHLPLCAAHPFHLAMTALSRLLYPRSTMSTQPDPSPCPCHTLAAPPSPHPHQHYAPRAPRVPHAHSRHRIARPQATPQRAATTTRRLSTPNTNSTLFSATPRDAVAKSPPTRLRQTSRRLPNMQDVATARDVLERGSSLGRAPDPRVSHARGCSRGQHDVDIWRRQ
jgi:hypothetical protein